ncbi:hypothetical protein QN277_001219 [Acacia crassicarpa]|uniref:Uncharacterized protein n=1 Tax=Acacia crassicarpa TaxID=499986 RepID=A0AAE1TI30_9FABA|nr:hypothetical protein QN277_001219 [Acacia crassicarpa]
MEEMSSWRAYLMNQSSQRWRERKKNDALVQTSYTMARNLCLS